MSRQLYELHRQLQRVINNPEMSWDDKYELVFTNLKPKIDACKPPVHWSISQTFPSNREEVCSYAEAVKDTAVQIHAMEIGVDALASSMKHALFDELENALDARSSVIRLLMAAFRKQADLIDTALADAVDKLDRAKARSEVVAVSDMLTQMREQLEDNAITDVESALSIIYNADVHFKGDKQ